MSTTSYDRMAGYSAIGAGLLTLVYSIAFVLLKNQMLYAVAQLLGGLLTLGVIIALYVHLRENGQSIALVALAFAAFGAVGSALHGGYDLANVVQPPGSEAAALASLPSPVDPRGLLTFGFAGLGVFYFASLMQRGDQFPRAVGYLGYLLAVLLILTYLGRLIILTPTSPLVLFPAALTGFLASPAFYLWLGARLIRTE
jgi:hypothetical protein